MGEALYRYDLRAAAYLIGGSCSGDGESGQRAATAPARELAQVQGVRLSDKAAVPGQEPGEGEPFGFGEGLEPGRLGQTKTTRSSRRSKRSTPPARTSYRS